jgi:hypothetical protein
MERLKSMKTNGVNAAICARARSDLRHHVDAISLALKNWNDTEALKLLRLHWREIAQAIHRLDLRPDLPEGIAVLQRDVAPSMDDGIGQFDEAIDGSSNDSGHRSPPPLRTFP